MQKHYFELDQVHSITLTTEKDSEYRWADAIPPRPKKFLGIRIGTKPAVDAGWTEYDEEDDFEWAYDRRKNSSYFEQYSWYKVNEISKKITIKPYIEVRFGYKESIGHQFESNEEAQSWIDDVISKSDKKFHVIINK